MNIKEHIEAGHYPLKDEKGRALVPMQHRGTATIYATDRGGRYPIVGIITERSCEPPVTWTEEGSHKSWSCDARDLLPPPPRKVKVPQSWALLTFSGKAIQGWTSCANQADEWRRTERGPVVELTGEYEEPWT